jgi:hypothetical protein
VYEPGLFLRDSTVPQRLEQGYVEDMQRAMILTAHTLADHGAVFVMPDAAWARRIIGVYANRLAQEHRDRAHAILSPNSQGGYTVSVRAPMARPSGADTLCRQFATGGGRVAAAGINPLDEVDLPVFVAAFLGAFGAAS